MKASYVFKVMLSTWRIWIKLTAEDSFTEGFENSMVVTDKISLSYKLPFHISNKEIEFLKMAIIRMDSQINEKIPQGERLFINIDELLFSEVDYQFEGLYCAMIGWLSDRYGIPEPRTDISFDKDKNKYLFAFH